MNKEQTVTELGTIVFFNRDVTAKELEALSDKSLTVVVNGNLSIKEHKEQFDFKGNLYVEGNINSSNSDVNIYGSLVCKKIECYNLSVTEDFDCNKCNALFIWVDGTLNAKHKVTGCVLEILGSLCAEEVYTDEIIVCGDCCCGIINTRGSDLSVIGDLECKEILDAGDITVWGKMHTAGSIVAKNIKVG